MCFWGFPFLCFPLQWGWPLGLPGLGGGSGGPCLYRHPPPTRSHLRERPADQNEQALRSEPKFAVCNFQSAFLAADEGSTFQVLYFLQLWLPTGPKCCTVCTSGCRWTQLRCCTVCKSRLDHRLLLSLFWVWGFGGSPFLLAHPSSVPLSLPHLFFSHAFSLSLPLWFALSHASLSPSHSLLTVSLSSLSLSDPLPESPRIWHRQLTVAVAVPRSPKWRVAMAQSFVATPLPHGRPNEIASRRP